MSDQPESGQQPVPPQPAPPAAQQPAPPAASPPVMPDVPQAAPIAPPPLYPPPAAAAAGGSRAGKRVPWIVSGVLVLAVAVVAFLLFQNVGQLNAAADEIETHKATITGLNVDLDSSRAEAADLKVRLGASEVKVLGLQTDVADLQADKTQLQADKTRLENELTSTKSQLQSVQSSLSSAQSSLSAAQSTNSTLSTNLKKVQDPRHFATVTELRDWLQRDDTNTRYASLSALEKCYVLQVRALRDGFILSVAIYDAGGTYYVVNEAVVGTEVYRVSASTDIMYLYATTIPIPSHPEPLP